MANKGRRVPYGWVVTGGAFVTGIIVVLARGTRDGQRLGALAITAIVVAGLLLGVAFYYGRRAFIRGRRIQARRQRERTCDRLVRQANDEALRGLFEQALATYDRALQMVSGYSPALAGRGAVLYERGDVEDALVEYGRAIEADTRCLGAYFGRANALMALDRIEDAISDYDIAISLAPGEMAILHNRGVAHARRGDAASARVDFTRAMERARDPAVIEVAKESLAALDAA